MTQMLMQMLKLTTGRSYHHPLYKPKKYNRTILCPDKQHFEIKIVKIYYPSILTFVLGAQKDRLILIFISSLTTFNSHLNLA